VAICCDVPRWNCSSVPLANQSRPLWYRPHSCALLTNLTLLQLLELLRQMLVDSGNPLLVQTDMEVIDMAAYIIFSAAFYIYSEQISGLDEDWLSFIADANDKFQ